jgi:hypothetical protein
MPNNCAAILVLVLSLWLPGTTGAEAEPPEPLYSQLTRAVVKLQRQYGTCDADSQKVTEKTVSIGSAFFVRDSFEGLTRYFIVTARHNVDRPVDHFVRVQIGPGAKQSVALWLPHSDWVFHPVATPAGQFPIDVAVMQISALPFIKAFLNCPSGGKAGECGLNDRTKKSFLNQIGKTPHVLSRVTFLGFPGGGLIPADSLEPMARGGVVASTTENANLQADGRRPFTAGSVYLVDAIALRGHSGGPVLKEQTPLSGALQLWGLVTASNDKGGRYTVVTRPEMISETIAHARQFAKVNSRWSPDLSALPLECATKQL